jgi:enamine deaminase RidA (YjgF/YER057c/UK114 family)
MNDGRMSHDFDQRFERRCSAFGVLFEPEIKPGANYELAVEHDGQVFVSGQVPRIQGLIVSPGRLGDTVTLDEGRRAASLCVLRSLAILQRRLGSLARVKKVLRMNVYVHSAPDFTQQSEVADAASQILYAVFAPDGGHARTSVGVAQLPKNAAVELDLLVGLHPGPVER